MHTLWSSDSLLDLGADLDLDSGAQSLIAGQTPWSCGRLFDPGKHFFIQVHSHWSWNRLDIQVHSPWSWGKLHDPKELRQTFWSRESLHSTQSLILGQTPWSWGVEANSPSSKCTVFDLGTHLDLDPGSWDELLGSGSELLILRDTPSPTCTCSLILKIFLYLWQNPWSWESEADQLILGILLLSWYRLFNPGLENNPWSFCRVLILEQRSWSWHRLVVPGTHSLIFSLSLFIISKIYH